VRRGVVAAGVAAALMLGSCGQGDLPSAMSADLQDRVAAIRRAAATGQRGIALRRLSVLVATVSSLLDAGRIDQGRGLEILESAEAVGTQLSLLPQPSPAQSPSPSPSPSPSQEEGNGGDGDGKGKGKGDEGHGNDD
jgi:hypothetical protein